VLNLGRCQVAIAPKKNTLLSLAAGWACWLLENLLTLFERRRRACALEICGLPRQ
jgi:hypothetical protein